MTLSHSTRIRIQPACAAALLIACALQSPSAAHAQDTREPNNRSITRSPDDGPRDAPILTPHGRPSANGADLNDPLRPSAGSLVREGAFIRNGRGRMVAGDGAAWIYIFDADARGKSEPPMILQPCIRLAEMRRLAEDKKETVTFSISGQVFVYEGRNYLLPTHFTTVSAASIQAHQLDVPDNAPPTTNTREGAVQSDDPRASDLLRELEKEEAIDAATSPRRAAPTPAAPAPASLLREGLVIVQRRGRVERAPGGAWVFITDNGPQNTGDPGADAPLRIAPCLILQEIERLVRERGERQVITLSGQIFVYEDRNYLIPTVFQLEPDREGNLTPAH